MFYDITTQKVQKMISPVRGSTVITLSCRVVHEGFDFMWSSTPYVYAPSNMALDGPTLIGLGFELSKAHFAISPMRIN